MKQIICLLSIICLCVVAQAQSATLQWNANTPSEGVTNYIIFNLVPPSTNFVKLADVGISTSYTPAVTGYGYAYYLRAQNASGIGGMSAIVTNLFPSPVQNLRITQVPNGTQFP